MFRKNDALSARAQGGSQLAQAAQPSVTAFAPLHAHGRIPAAALVDLCYRCVGELVDVDEVLARARAGEQ